MPRCTTRSITRSRAADMPTDAGAFTGSPPFPAAMAAAASSARTTMNPSSEATARNLDSPRRVQMPQLGAWGYTPRSRYGGGPELSQEQSSSRANREYEPESGGLKPAGRPHDLRSGELS